MVPPVVGKAFGQFIKSNASIYSGGFGLLFAANDIKNIAESDNKLKALGKTLKDFLFWRTALAGTFLALGAAIRGLVKDTGSLDAALKRLQAIQGAKRALAPFVGGTQAARGEVTNLLEFSARSPFTFEESVQADRTLHAQTRGAFAGTGALQKVGDAAAASGNSLGQSAEAVGQFYAALHNGEPIHQVVENLRQMGLISDTAATHMMRMAEAGASSTESVNELNRALEESKGGMASYAQELEAVSAAHEKAAEGAKAAFGEGFTAPPIQSTKNYTAALVAITPALHDVGQFFAGFTQQFETWGSKIAKAAAQSGLLGNAIKILSLALTAGAIALTVYGLAVIPLIGPVAALVGGLTALGLVLNSVAHAEKEAARELTRLGQAHRQAQAEINAHASAIQTLTDLHEQYGRSVSHIIDLQNELVAAEKKGDSKKIQEIIRALKEAHAEMAKLPAAQNLASPERGAVIEERMAERRDRERERFQEQIEQEPGRAGELSEQRAGVLEERAERGRQGLQLRQRVAERQGNLLPQQGELQAQIGELESAQASLASQGKKLDPEDFKRLETLKDNLAGITAPLLKIQQIEGQNAAVGTEAEIQRLQHAQQANVLEQRAAGMKEGRDKKDVEREAARERMAAGGAQAGPDVGRKIQDLQAVMAEQLEDEKNVRENAAEARQLRGTDIRESRQRAVVGEEIGLEHGAAQATLRGDSRGRQAFQDMGEFLQNFEQLRQLFPKEQARQLAVEKTQDTIAQSAELLPGKPVAGELTRIGGGGGVGGPHGDPAQRTRERMMQVELQSQRILEHIDANTKKETHETGGGAANPILEAPPGAPGTPEEAASPPTEGTMGPSLAGRDEQIGQIGQAEKRGMETNTQKDLKTAKDQAFLNTVGINKPAGIPATKKADEVIRNLQSEKPGPLGVPDFAAPASKSASPSPKPAAQPRASIPTQLQNISKAKFQYYTPEQFEQASAEADKMAAEAESESRANPAMSEQDEVKAAEGSTIGTKDHPLPKQPWSNTIKVAPIKAPQAGLNSTGKDNEMLGALNKLVRGNMQSNEHLTTITEQNDRGIA